MSTGHDPYAPFRPRQARIVASVLAVAAILSLTVLSIVLPVVAGIATGPLDRVGIGGLGLAIAWFCYRQASVRAVPDTEGLNVRNLLLSRRVEWSEIVSVRFGQGRPWVQLDLADGDTLAVMGIQRSDGAFGQAEASRLATLVAAHEGHGPAD